MNLDSLFQQILLTEQLQAEQTQRFKEVKVATIKCNAKIKAAREKYEDTSQQLEEKCQQLCGMHLQIELIKRREEQVSRQMDELLKTKEHLREQLVTIKQQCSEEQEGFLEELCRFNTDMSLTADSEAVAHRQTEEDIQGLIREEEALKQEMEQMSHGNRHVRFVQEEKGALLLELRGLDSIVRDVDVQLSEAKALSQTLRAQRDLVSKKTLTDPTCLWLRKELDVHREGEMEAQRETLSSELLILQAQLVDLQRREQL